MMFSEVKLGSLKRIKFCDIILLICGLFLFTISLLMFFVGCDVKVSLFLLFIGLLLTILMFKEIILINFFIKHSVVFIGEMMV